MRQKQLDTESELGGSSSENSSDDDDEVDNIMRKRDGVDITRKVAKLGKRAEGQPPHIMEDQPGRREGEPELDEKHNEPLTKFETISDLLKALTQLARLPDE